MKKVFLALLVAIVTSTCAYAQKGASAAGINLGYGITLGDSYKDYSNIPIGLKYQYGITDALRLEAVLNYGIGINKDFGGGIKMKMDAVTYGINAHYIVNPESTFKFYPIVGIGGGTVTAKASYDSVSSSSSETGFMYNIGVGGEYSLTQNIALGLEIKFQSIMISGDNFNQLPILLGLTYKF